jgi:hypothetical protein
MGDLLHPPQVMVGRDDFPGRQDGRGNVGDVALQPDEPSGPSKCFTIEGPAGAGGLDEPDAFGLFFPHR